jgi:hypothetical protein
VRPLHRLENEGEGTQAVGTSGVAVVVAAVERETNVKEGTGSSSTSTNSSRRSNRRSRRPVQLVSVRVQLVVVFVVLLLERDVNTAE